MNSTDKYGLFYPLFITPLFIFVVLFLHNMGGIGTENDPNETIFVIIFAAFVLADLLFIIPRLLMPQVMNATTKQDVLKYALMPIVMTEISTLAGFVLFFLFNSLLYFGAFTFLGLASWLYFYRKIENKLNQVQ